MTVDTKSNELSDEEFIRQFEDLSLQPEHFNHLGHLRIAWLYLSRYGMEQANFLVCRGIKTYAESLGAKDKFHLTITDALVKIIAQRMSCKTTCWKNFLNKNNDLIEDAKSILLGYFSEELLFSDVARKTLVKSDLKDLNF